MTDVGTALAEVLREIEAGTPPTAADLARRYPAFAAELADWLPGEDPVRVRLEPLRDRTTPDILPVGPGCTFGDFRLDELLAVGGMGVVYRAYFPPLDRTECLKVIRSGAFADAADRARLLREATHLAGLAHPHIVPVYRSGEIDGRVYFSMPFVPGRDLAGHLARYRGSPRLAADLVAKVARAVHHAHQRGLLHRDLKPANVLIDADGRPLVSDFGLARRPGDPAAASASAGTPAYMAPEQAEGRAADVTTLTDVWGIGAILFEILVGRPPRATGPATRSPAPDATEPPRPRTLAPDVDPTLDAVCRKCLRRNPADRYPSALAVAEDLECYLRGDRPVGVSSGFVAAVGHLVHEERPGIAALRPAAAGLLGYTGVVLGIHLAAAAVLARGGPELAIWAAVFASYLPLFAVLALRADPRLANDRSGLRLMWSVWVGHLFGCLAVVVPRRLAAGADPAAAFVSCYPAFAALTGVAFVVMGSAFWGRQYVLGGLWFGLAAVIPLDPARGPLGYAGLMLVCNLVMATRRDPRPDRTGLARRSSRRSPRGAPAAPG